MKMYLHQSTPRQCPGRLRWHGQLFLYTSEEQSLPTEIGDKLKRLKASSRILSILYMMRMWKMSIFNLWKYVVPLLNTRHNPHCPFFSVLSIDSSKQKQSNLKLALCPIKTLWTLRGGWNTSLDIRSSLQLWLQLPGTSSQKPSQTCVQHNSLYTECSSLLKLGF